MADFKIEESKIGSYVKREVKKITAITAITVVSVSFGMIIFSKSIGLRGAILIPIVAIALSVLVAIYASSLTRIKDRVAKMIFRFDDEQVAVQVQENGGKSLRSLKGGLNQRYNRSIKVEDLSSTKITTQGIVFKSEFNEDESLNGKIVIPKEVNGFDTIIEKVRSAPSRFHLEA